MKKVVIIGSGLGGLSCGAVLAKNGYEVTVLEQGAQVGGCLQCFTRQGVKFETGMHFIGSAAKGQTLQRLFRYLEVDIQLSQLDPKGYEVISLDGHRYAFATGREPFIDTLAAQFPDQRDNLHRLWDIIDHVASASSLHSLRHTETEAALDTRYQLCSINAVLQEVITDARLREVLVGNLPLYAAEWDKTPFSTYAFIMDFYNQSAWRVVGGSDHVAKALVETLHRHGGKVITRKKVTAVDCDDRHATGVTCADGSHYTADLVIADIHPARLMEIVTSPLLRPAYRKRIADLPETVGGFALYVRFKENRVPYMNHNFYSYRQGSPWHCERYTTDNWPMGYLYMHFCDTDQQTYARSGVILSYMRMEEVERWKGTRRGCRGDDYLRFKQEHAERLLDVVEHDFPHLRDNTQDYESSTPLTYLDYTGTEGGSMYGIAKDITRGVASRVHHRTKIPNLMLTGQNINSHGILGVLVGTMVTCGEVLTSERIFQQIADAQ
jgi:all-trans-retinol 13,14-reductase